MILGVPTELLSETSFLCETQKSSRGFVVRSLSQGQLFNNLDFIAMT
jgi:hypothetical protein